MSYNAIDFVYGEQPSATKWNYLGSNDAGFKDGTNIDDDAIIARHIADNAVGTAQIANNAITADKIAAGAVGADEIATNAVGTAEIANDAVTVDKLADNCIAQPQLQNDCVGINEIEDGLFPFNNQGPYTNLNIIFNILNTTNTGTTWTFPSAGQFASSSTYAVVATVQDGSAASGIVATIKSKAAGSCIVQNSWGTIATSMIAMGR